MTNAEIIKDARKQTDMSQSEFADYFGIPKRTLQDWEYEKRKMPQYLLRLMIYKLEIEKMVSGLGDEISEGAGEQE